MNRNPSEIVAAIRGLSSEEIDVRVSARERLEKIGKPGTWHLIQAMYPPGEKTRHEALKTLVGLADPAAADLFIETLEDEDSDCRWLAAQGLAALGQEGLRRSLELLITFPSTEHLLRSLHHVLSELEKTGYEGFAGPVLRAFQETGSEVAVPTAAHEALNALRMAKRSHPDQDTPIAR